MVACTLVCAFFVHVAGGSDKENRGEATQGMFSEVSEAIFLDNAKVLIRNPSESLSFSPFPAIPSHSQPFPAYSQPIPSTLPRRGAALRPTSSRVKGCAMLVEATKPPSRRTLDGKAV